MSLIEICLYLRIVNTWNFSQFKRCDILKVFPVYESLLSEIFLTLIVVTIWKLLQSESFRHLIWCEDPHCIIGRLFQVLENEELIHSSQWIWLSRHLWLWMMSVGPFSHPVTNHSWKQNISSTWSCNPVRTKPWSTNYNDLWCNLYWRSYIYIGLLSF